MNIQIRWHWKITNFVAAILKQLILQLYTDYNDQK